MPARLFTASRNTWKLFDWFRPTSMCGVIRSAFFYFRSRYSLYRRPPRGSSSFHNAVTIGSSLAQSASTSRARLVASRTSKPSGRGTGTVQVAPSAMS